MDRRQADAAVRKNPFASHKIFPTSCKIGAAKDNTGFTAAIGTAKEAFKDHLDKKSRQQGLDEINDTNQQANDLYLGLLAIQNAATNEHDEDDPTTRGIRAKYRLDLFPPHRSGNQDPAPTPTPAAP